MLVNWHFSVPDPLLLCTVGNHVIESRKTYAETGVYLQNNVIYNLYVVYQSIVFPQNSDMNRTEGHFLFATSIIY